MKAKSQSSAREVADWMIEELARAKFLHQSVAVDVIAARFGDDFIYINSNGNRSIDRRVLAQFKSLTGDNVIWERGERCWRAREAHDEPGRLQR